MSDTIIRVEKLGKKYILSHQQEGHGKYKALRDVIVDGVKSLGSIIQNPKSKIQNDREEFWALQDVSFEIKRGDRVGIIGRNGAGKSTLLKILSRITEPTTGKISLKGRVASLLEVGTGFHPELTGKENIYLNGAILGMSRAEIKRKFDEIVAFAEVEKFLDTPVKRYSSGMYVRLAFAVAAHLEPEILIVDEVLAVGDAQFQKKCLGKMEDVGKEGRTVLFVSHNMGTVRKLCSSAILLKRGEVEDQGSTEEITEKYINDDVEAQSIYSIKPPRDERIPGYAYKLSIEDSNGSPAAAISVGQPWQIRVSFKIKKTINSFIIAVGFMTSEDIPLRTCWSQPCKIIPGEYDAIFREENLLLATGKYKIIVGLSQNEIGFHYVENAGVLEISEVVELNSKINLVRTASVGLLLNPMQIEIKSI